MLSVGILSSDILFSCKGSVIFLSANRCTRPLGSCLCTGAGAGVLFGSGNCAKRESPIYTQLYLYIPAHSYAHVQVHVHGVAQVKSDTWCGRLPAGIGGGVTDLPDHLQVQFFI